MRTLKTLRIVLGIIIGCALLCGYASAKEQVFDVGKHTVKVDLSLGGNWLKIRGILFGSQSCEELTLYLSVSNTAGDAKKLKFFFPKYVPGVTKRFEIEASVPGGAEYEIQGLDILCK